MALKRTVFLFKCFCFDESLCKKHNFNGEAEQRFFRNISFVLNNICVSHVRKYKTSFKDINESVNIGGANASDQ